MKLSLVAEILWVFEYLFWVQILLLCTVQCDEKMVVDTYKDSFTLKLVSGATDSGLRSFLFIFLFIFSIIILLRE